MSGWELLGLAALIVAVAAVTAGIISRFTTESVVWDLESPEDRASVRDYVSRLLVEINRLEEEERKGDQ